MKIINDKKALKLEKKLRKLRAQGWNPDKHYVCIEAFNKKDRRIVYGWTYQNKSNKEEYRHYDGIVFCPYCDEEIIEVQNHFYIGKNFNEKAA